MNYQLEATNTTCETYEFKIGTIYLYDDYAIAEFNEGADISFNSVIEISQLIESHFKDQPFGFISNRINSYAVNVNDAKKFNAKFKNKKAYGIVAYNSLTERTIEFENHFCDFNRKVFNDLESAKDWVEETLALQTTDSLL